MLRGELLCHRQAVKNAANSETHSWDLVALGMLSLKYSLRGKGMASGLLLFGIIAIEQVATERSKITLTARNLVENFVCCVIGHSSHALNLYAQIVPADTFVFPSIERQVGEGACKHDRLAAIIS